MIDNAICSIDASTITTPIKVRDVLVLGLGNILLGDDGVGIHAVQHLAADPNAPRGLKPVDGGTIGFRLMDVFASANAVILIDAAQLDEPAGTVRLVELAALDRFVQRGGRISAHEAGLVDLITLVRIDGGTPARLALIGIQPQWIHWNDGLSPAVASALPNACRLAIDLVLQWQHAA